MGVRPAKSPEHGVTLIELMVVLAITAILLAVGVPMFSTFVDRNRVAAEVNELIADLALTRSEALARRGRVGICASNDGISCVAGDWETSAGNMRWVVFVDSGTTNFTLDSTDLVVREQRVSSRIKRVRLDPTNRVRAFSGLYATSDGSVFAIYVPVDTTNNSLATTQVMFHFEGDSTHTENYRTVCLINGRARSVKTDNTNPDLSCV